MSDNDAGAFAARLLQAIEAHPDRPVSRTKRRGWFLDHLQRETGLAVSRNTVHKWTTGQSAPEQNNGVMIARALGVDPAWLMLGSRAAGSRPEGPKTVPQSAPEAQVLRALLEAAGVTAAPPKIGTPDAPDLYVVHGGAVTRVAVAAMEKTPEGFEFAVPTGGFDVALALRVDPAAFGVVDVYDVTRIARTGAPGRPVVVAAADVPARVQDIDDILGSAAA